MLTALSGTPGTGKTTVARVLGEAGLDVCTVEELVASQGTFGSYDSVRESWPVDLEALRRLIPERRPLLLVGHLSHLLPADIVIVLRCHPDILRARLERQGWRPSKIQENVEAEALGVITHEALERGEAFEIDSTSTSPEEVARTLLLIQQGRGEEYRAGKVDWSEVILNWY